MLPGISDAIPQKFSLCSKNTHPPIPSMLHILWWNCCASSSGICFSHHLTVILGISNFSLDFGCIRHHNKRVAYHVLETIVFQPYMIVAHITLQPCVCWLLNLPVHFMMTGPGLETLELYPYIWNKHFKFWSLTTVRVLVIFGTRVLPPRLCLTCGFPPTFG